MFSAFRQAASTLVQRIGLPRAGIVALALGLSIAVPGAGLAADPADQAAYDAAFDAMQRDPGNSDKALVYAEAAIKVGDLEGAIGALERLLIFNPDLPKLQLEVGVLYYRLGSYALARTYLAELQNRTDLSDEDRAKVSQYLAQIDHQSSQHHFGGNLTTGFRYQTNSNFGPSGSTFNIIGLQVPIPNGANGKGDGNFFGLATGSYVYDFQRADPLTIEANLTLYGAKQFKETQFDLSLTQLDVGPRIGLPWLIEGANVRPYLVGDFLSLGGASLFESYGGGFSAYTPIWGKFDIQGSFELQNRQYPVNPGLPLIETRTGDYIVTRLAPRYTITPNQWISLMGEYDRAMAVQGTQRYTQYTVGPTYSANFEAPFLPFVKPWTATVGFNHVWRFYGEPDPIVDPFDNRFDREWNVGGTLEIGIVERISAVVQLQQAWVKSTIPNYAYTNTTGVLGLSFSF
jgi:tetratricopeptide (TPR) repeat protein